MTKGLPLPNTRMTWGRIRFERRVTVIEQPADVSLHSYRYAWAERAKRCGYPERFAQEALGHNSKAVHRAYARRAQVKLPSLESYERQREDGRIIQMPQFGPEMHQVGTGGQKVG
jgi:integrase